MNMNRFLPLLIAYRKWIAAGLVAFSLSLLIGAGRHSPKHQVVTTTHDLKAGSVIRAGDIQLTRLNFIWPNAVTQASSIVGTRTTHNLEKNEPLSQFDLGAKKIFDPLNPRAVTISLPANSSTADLRIGDRVDIYASTQSGRVQKVAGHALILGKPASNSAMDANGTISLAISSEQVAKISACDSSVRFTFVTLPS
jgi:Flp pilus assembly protein CpaB